MKKNAYTGLPLKERLVNKILIYYQTIWAEKRFTASNHKLWLANFKEGERLNSLYLLSRFMFFGSDEIRELLISIFRDKYKYKIVESFRMSNGNTTNFKDIETAFKSKLEKTRFVGLGDASESGGHILMVFRQVNKLATKFMKNSAEIFSNGVVTEPDVDHYIFLDDFCGSGETAINCNSLISSIKAANPAAQVSYYVLFATSDGFQNVKNHSKFDSVASCFVLDQTFRCFAADSRYYTEVEPDLDCTESQSFCSGYGTPLVIGTPIEGHPLGFDNGQLLLSFPHNTPDNTLPVFWGEANGWKPMFVRYIKTKN